MQSVCGVLPDRSADTDSRRPGRVSAGTLALRRRSLPPGRVLLIHPLGETRPGGALATMASETSAIANTQAFTI